MTTESEDLALIRQLMGDAQQAVEDNGTHYVLWGTLTALGLAGTWVVVTRPLPTAWMWPIWGAVGLVGWITASVIGRRARERAPVRTLAARLLRETWASVGAALSVLFFAGAGSGAIHVSAIPGVMATVIGVGFFASASLYKGFPMRIIGLLWWIGGASMLVWRGTWTILLMAGMVVALEVVPGLMLRARRRAPAA